MGDPRKLATPIFAILRPFDFCISASDGRRQFSDTAKCSQWPHLYKSYEATYTLKLLVFDKIAKN